ncbi:phytanoyl-CoA dioxygenase family protein [Vicingaceae bacterium]|nr:phytanoyl-CoA dioxygenase family protein [Vicingaceae bacterium]
MLNASQKEIFDRDGFLAVNAFLSTEETKLLRETCASDVRLTEASRGIQDAEGRNTQLTLWNHPGDDIYGMISRSRRAVESMKLLLGDEVYHYHSKLSAKQPKVGGAWEWHQDYGYWYNNGCLFPDMASLFIAIDPCTIENGCLQVIRGSHKLGRIEHGVSGGQTGADMERVDQALAKMELIHCKMNAGDALFFHCNTLHRSDANRSEHPRWGLITCYNTRHNDPFREHHHPGYTPLEIVPDSSILQCGKKISADDKQFSTSRRKD